MFSAMSGTSERVSTMPASAMVFAGEICGGASALAAMATAASAQPSAHAASLEPAATLKTVRVERSGAKLREVETLFALRLRAFGTTLSANGILRRVLFTAVLPCERKILVVIAEIRIRIDLGHVQHVAGLGGEIQPCFGIAVEPVHEVLVAHAHHFAGEIGGFLRGELYLVALGAEARLAEPRITPHAEFVLQFARRGSLA